MLAGIDEFEYILFLSSNDNSGCDLELLNTGFYLMERLVSCIEVASYNIVYGSHAWKIIFNFFIFWVNEKPKEQLFSYVYLVPEVSLIA